MIICRLRAVTLFKFSPLDLFPLAGVGDRCDVLHDVFAGFRLPCSTFTWETHRLALNSILYCLLHKLDLEPVCL